MSLMRFNTHVGLAQGHSNYLHILNLESGTNQSYMPRKKQCVCVCVCVWEGEVSCYKVHIHRVGGIR